MQRHRYPLASLAYGVGLLIGLATTAQAHATAKEADQFDVQAVRVVEDGPFGWGHEIRVALPKSYAHSQRAYPVLWLLDGDSLFPIALKEIAAMSEPNIQELIVVGINATHRGGDEAQSRRVYEYTSSSTAGFTGPGGDLLKKKLMEAGQFSSKRGGASSFLNYLVAVLRPELAALYRMSDQQVLFGHSAGGTFCTYAVLSRPGSFSDFICISPALYSGDSDLFRIEQEYSQSHQDLPARVFFAVGEEEMLEKDIVPAFGTASSMSRMVEILGLRDYRSLMLRERIFAGKDHRTVVSSALIWGLKGAFEGSRRPPDGGREGH